MTKKQRLFVQRAEPGRDEFLQGYAAALASIRRLYHEDSIVTGVMTADGIRYEFLKACGASHYDLKQIRLAMGMRR